MPNDRGPAIAGMAALLVGGAYAWGGIPRQLAGLVVLFVLLVPGPTGHSMLFELIQFTNDRLTKGF